MPFHLFLFMALFCQGDTKAAIDCSLIERCSGTKRKQKQTIKEGLLFPPHCRSECVCVPVASIVLWIDLWKLVCSPFGQIVKPSGYHRGTGPVWTQARIGGSTTLWPYFPKASRCRSFCNGFLENGMMVCVDGWCRRFHASWSTTHTWANLVLPCRTNMFESDVVYYWLMHGQENAYLNQSLTH